MKLKSRIIGEGYGMSKREIRDNKGNSYYHALKFKDGSRAASANLILTWN